MVVSALADQNPSIANDEGIDWPVVMGHGEFFGRREHLLVEREGHCDGVRICLVSFFV